VDETRLQSLTEVQSSLDYFFKEISYLDRALTHSSYRHEAKSMDVLDNERLEFLGDAVLNFIVSNHLFHLFPNIPEGRLAKLKAVIVSEPVLSEKGRSLQLGKYLQLGRGEQKSGGAERVSILGDAFEAVIGAIYLDGGIEGVEPFILCQLESDFQSLSKEDYFQDFKSILQEHIQANFATVPIYQSVSESGPDHDKRFIVNVTVNREEYGIGEGKNKKEAEQKAAQQACEKLKIRSSSFSDS
jgi:ribonuclease III